MFYSQFSDSTKLPKTFGLNHLKQNLLVEGISKRATTFIANSRRTSSSKHYESAWGKWVSWCRGRRICPTVCDMNNILDNVLEFFASGLQYNTVGSHRSAILAFHDPIGDIKVEDRPRIFALMTGVFNQTLL